jgi:hypothetical protein
MTITLIRCHLAVTLHIGRWTRMCPGVPQWHFNTQLQHVATQIHRYILGMQDINWTHQWCWQQTPKMRNWKLGPLGTSATIWPIAPAPDDRCGVIGGVINRGNLSTQGNLPQCCFVQHKFHMSWPCARTWATMVGSWWLTTWAMVVIEDAAPESTSVKLPSGWGGSPLMLSWGHAVCSVSLGLSCSDV